MLGEEDSQWERAPLFKLMMSLASGYTAGVRYEFLPPMHTYAASNASTSVCVCLCVCLCVFLSVRLSIDKKHIR